MPKRKSKHAKHLESLRKKRHGAAIKSLKREASLERVTLRVEQNKAKAHHKIAEAIAHANDVDLDAVKAEHAKADRLVAKHVKTSRTELLQAGKSYAKTWRARHEAKQTQALAQMQAGPTSRSFVFLCEAEDFSSHTNLPAAGTTTQTSSTRNFGENLIQARVVGQGPSFSAVNVVRHEFDFVWVPDQNGFARVVSNFILNGLVQLTTPNVCTYFEPVSLAVAEVRLYMNTSSLNGDEYSWQHALAPVSRTDGGALVAAVQGEHAVEESQYILFQSGLPVTVTAGVEMRFQSWNGGRAEFDFRSGALEIGVPFVMMSLF